MEQTEQDFRDIERDRDLPPDEPYEDHAEWDEEEDKMHADTIISFSQEDEDEYRLVWEDDEGDKHTLTMRGMEALRLYGVVTHCVADYHNEMQAALASFKRGDGPNGEPKGTWEDQEADVHSVSVRYIEPHMADLYNKARKENK